VEQLAGEDRRENLMFRQVDFHAFFYYPMLKIEITKLIKHSINLNFLK